MQRGVFAALRIESQASNKWMLQFAIALNESHLNCWPHCLYNLEWGIESLLSTEILWFGLNWIIPIVTASLRIQLNHESQKWWNPSTSESLVSLIRVDNTTVGLHWSTRPRVQAYTHQTGRIKPKVTIHFIIKSIYQMGSIPHKDSRKRNIWVLSRLT